MGAVVPELATASTKTLWQRVDDVVLEALRTQAAPRAVRAARFRGASPGHALGFGLGFGLGRAFPTNERIVSGLGLQPDVQLALAMAPSNQTAPHAERRKP